MTSFDDIAEQLSDKETNFVSARKTSKVLGWVDTGNYALNWAISNRLDRGYPLGHVVEIFGPESSGKSLLIARAIAEFQKKYEDGKCFLDDTEYAFNPDWAEKSLGVNVDELGITSSVTIEDHFKMVEKIITYLKKKDLKGLVALDSIALLSDDHEIESDFKVSKVGGKAKEIRKLFRKLRPMLQNYPCLYMLTNHETANIGGWGSDTTTTGGSGPRYQASVRLQLRAPKQIRKGSNTVGVFVRPYVKKTRFATPYRETHISLPFDRPISRTSGLIPVLLEIGAIGESGRTLTIDGEDTGIYTQKTNPIKQDTSSAELFEKYPDIIQKANSILEEQEQERAIDLDQLDVSISEED